MLVLDDATSAVDTRTEEQIHATLRELMADRTTMLIAHRRSTLRLADRIVVVDDGRVVEEGTHEELLATVGALPRPARAARATTPRARPTTETARRPSGVTATLWAPRRGRRTSGRRASCAAPTRSAAHAAWARQRRRRPPAASAAGRALAPTPELLAAVAALPPADDDPEVDVAAEAARRARPFRLARFLRPYRRPLLIGFGLVVVDTLLTLAGPFLVR